MEILLIILGMLALIPLILFYNALCYGLIIQIFYGWFILPLFPTLPHFTVLQFIGIAFFLYTIMPKSTYISLKDEYKDKSNEGWIFLLSPWIVLGCGYLLHFFY